MPRSAGVDRAASKRLREVAGDSRVGAIWHQTGRLLLQSLIPPLIFNMFRYFDKSFVQGLVECEYQFRNDRWNCTDNRDTARIQTTLERGICISRFVDLMLSDGIYQ